MNNGYNGNGYYDQQGYYAQQPVQNEDPRAAAANYVEQMAGSVFGKALASMILSQFPITSVIAIILGASANSALNEIKKVAEGYGIKGGGKYMASRVLSKIGLFSGIAMTVFWTIYILYLVFIYSMVTKYGF